ncbi:hypothetical protein [Candidatus Endolissoclinum faulkneri]|nr:hypothetical protein [Candidatus Endolissoclinum faulkneri]
MLLTYTSISIPLDREGHDLGNYAFTAINKATAQRISGGDRKF